MIYECSGYAMRGVLIVFLCVVFLTQSGVSAWAGFDDFLKDVLLETSRPLGSDEYVFSPGDVVIKRTGYLVYYAGYESHHDVQTLLFTIVEPDTSYQVKFPSPDIIQIKDVKLKIIAFDNEALRLKLVRTPPHRQP